MSIYHYAAELASMSKSMVNDTLWIQRKIAGKPELQRVAERKGLHAVRPVLTISGEDGRVGFWADKAMAMGRHTLEQYVRDYRNTFRTGPKVQSDRVDESAQIILNSTVSAGPTPADAILVSAGPTPVDATLERVWFDLPVELARKMEKLKNNKKFLKMLIEIVENFEESDIDGDAQDGIANIQGLGHAIDEVVDSKGLGHAIDSIADAKKFGHATAGVSDVKTVGLVTRGVEERSVSVLSNLCGPDPVRTDSRHIPAAIRRHVEVRARGRCEFSGCGRPYAIFHHTQRWDLEHVHDPDRIVALCKNHERIAHCGLIENEDDLPHKWVVRAHADFSDRRFYVDSLVATHRG